MIKDRIKTLREKLKNCNIDAVSAASIFHYDFIRNRFKEKHTDSEGNFEFLHSGRSMKTIKSSTIKEIKLLNADSYLATIVAMELNFCLNSRPL